VASCIGSSCSTTVLPQSTPGEMVLIPFGGSEQGFAAGQIGGSAPAALLQGAQVANNVAKTHAVGGSAQAKHELPGP